MTVTILVSIACFIVGGLASYLFFKHGLKSKCDKILKDARPEPESGLQRNSGSDCLLKTQDSAKSQDDV